MIGSIPKSLGAVNPGPNEKRILAHVVGDPSCFLLYQFSNSVANQNFIILPKVTAKLPEIEGNIESQLLEGNVF